MMPLPMYCQGAEDQYCLVPIYRGLGVTNMLPAEGTTLAALTTHGLEITDVNNKEMTLYKAASYV